MIRDSLVGSRIRERRVMAGLKQAELAATVNISASYLNLIEHNKRRIGGKLLVDLAGALGVEPSLLSEGAEAALIATLREAAADAPKAEPELDRTDEFAGRFPGWARLVAERHQQVQSLERTVEALSDRFAHDPHLATSMHELLSMVTAIRSTAGILHESKDIEPEWQGRFHRNLNEDSQRLADSAQSLVDFLDTTQQDTTRGTSPQDEMDAFLKEQSYHFPALEQSGGWPDQIIDATTTLKSTAARSMARHLLATYQRDAQAMPKHVFLDAIKDIGVRPDALAQRFGVSLPAAMRRCAAMPAEDMPMAVGLVVSDGAGALLVRHEVEGFPVPRFSAACAKWPLFHALTRPMQPVRATVEMAGRDGLQFDCLAVAEPVGPVSFEKDPLYQASMLILPNDEKSNEPRLIGSTCRICPRRKCQGRSVHSILTDGI